MEKLALNDETVSRTVLLFFKVDPIKLSAPVLWLYTCTIPSSSLKLHGQSKPNFMSGLLGKVRPKSKKNAKIRNLSYRGKKGRHKSKKYTKIRNCSNQNPNPDLKTKTEKTNSQNTREHMFNRVSSSFPKCGDAATEIELEII